jgi:hypothetical protein
MEARSGNRRRARGANIAMVHSRSLRKAC